MRASSLWDSVPAMFKKADRYYETGHRWVRRCKANVGMWVHCDVSVYIYHSRHSAQVSTTIEYGITDH